MAAPVRFALKPSKKRRRQDESDEKKKTGASVCAAFFTVEALRQEERNASTNHMKRRGGLLEDVQAKVKRLKDEGNTLAEAGRFKAATGRWQEALAVDPDNSALYDLLAQASMAVYEDFQAVQFARKATELAPTWSDGFLTLARCQLNFGELTLALEALKQAVEHNGGVETEEMASDRRDIEGLLLKQEQVLRKRDQETALEVKADKLQVISCFKHLSLRAKAIEMCEGSRNE
ncbi:Tetratricopeptide repeat protein 33 [Phytophthora pseudosyringae]|uniref:Tetratricopeptide repeat protein 33 n=1 Tax=Phytophthora pseudosyringae TaxID=221518 RepID=A0A8T1WKI8_9STRA|nr:Tetratricopeptide repeat protein 33 [Phytophthora pseudosyringae]